MSAKIAMFKLYGVDELPRYKPVKVLPDKNGSYDCALEIADHDICARYNVDPEDIELISLE